MKFKESYRLQDGCHNCAHAYWCDDYDSWRIYCTLGSPKRPPGPCRGDKMPRTTPAEEDAAWDAWEAWEQARKVREVGICDHWKEQEKIQDG